MVGTRVGGVEEEEGDGRRRWQRQEEGVKTKKEEEEAQVRGGHGDGAGGGAALPEGSGSRMVHGRNGSLADDGSAFVEMDPSQRYGRFAEELEEGRVRLCTRRLIPKKDGKWRGIW